MEGFIIAFLLWTLFAFGAGIVVHWWMTRKQRRLLKQYRSRERVRQHLNRPIE